MNENGLGSSHASDFPWPVRTIATVSLPRVELSGEVSPLATRHHVAMKQHDARRCEEVPACEIAAVAL
jgi:hypothetical protein